MPLDQPCSGEEASFQTPLIDYLFFGLRSLKAEEQ